MKILTGITLIGVLVIVSGLLLAGMGGVETTVSRGPAIPMAAPSPMQAQPQATPNPVRQVVQSVPAAQAAPTPVLAEATPLPEGQAVTAHAQQQMSGILIFIAAGTDSSHVTA